MHYKRGFTLIELMIVVAIIAILAMVAYPAYTAQIKKSKQSAAQQYMMEVALAEDQYILDNGSYTDRAGLGMTTLPDEVDGVYTITAAATTAPFGYTITATPVSGGIMDGESTMTLLSTGAKTNW